MFRETDSVGLSETIYLNPGLWVAPQLGRQNFVDSAGCCWRTCGGKRSGQNRIYKSFSVAINPSRTVDPMHGAEKLFSPDISVAYCT